MVLDLQKISLQVGEYLRGLSIEPGNVPIRTGELRKSHLVHPYGATDALLSANTPYAAAVHEGRRAITIRPRSKKAILWNGAAHPVRAVHQPARPGNAWMRRAVETLARDGLDFLAPELGPAVADDLAQSLRRQGLTVSVSK